MTKTARFHRLLTIQAHYSTLSLDELSLSAEPARETALGFACLLLDCSIEFVNTLHQLFASLVLVFLGFGFGFREFGLCIGSLWCGQ